MNQHSPNRPQNVHQATVDGFGDEWERFDQSSIPPDEHEALFKRYFDMFPWQDLPNDPVGFDMGCGSGRWAKLVAPRAGTLHCIDPSSALKVAQRNLSEHGNCIFHAAGVGDRVLPEASMDFGYSLGVLHHVPNTAAAIAECARMLKPRAPFLLYLYYAFDNRPFWYRWLWKATDLVRQWISRLPHQPRYLLCQMLAFTVYWPAARLLALAQLLGVPSRILDALPLASYRSVSLYTMRTDALDRFGTRLEQRFTQAQICQMLESAGIQDIKFSPHVPFWCVLGRRRA